MALGVSGSGEAKISASRIGFSSALASRGASSPSGPTGPTGPTCPTCPCPTCPSRPSRPSCPICSSMVVFRIADGMRRVRRTRALVDADRTERALLEHAHQLQADHLEEREERHDEATAIGAVGEQILEAARVGLGDPLEQLVDTHLHRYLLWRQKHFRPQLSALHDLLERVEKAEEIDLELGL